MERLVRITSLVLAPVVALAVLPAHGGDVRFEEVGADSGILTYTMANGMGASVAAADFDDDGDVDLFVPTESGLVDLLYLNDGDGTFTDIAVQAGVASTRSNRIALWFDYDGDGLLDLVVAGDCWQAEATCPSESTLTLYHQIADRRFEDVTVAAGFGDDYIVTTSAHRGGMVAGDINNDGWLDLVIGIWGGSARLLRNNGDGTFDDIGQSAGVGGRIEAHWQPMIFDVDGDGWQDIYYAIDFAENRLWLNQHDETFVDVAAAAGLANRWNDMGMALGDIDNDGDLDIYVTNVTTGDRHNVLYRNDTVAGVPAFVEIAEAAGVDWGGWGWGATFLDADNDGWLDLAATNGWVSGAGASDPSRFYRNAGTDPVTFSDRSVESGFDDTYWGSALVAADYDRDGDLDLIQTANGSGIQSGGLRLLRNDLTGLAAANHWIAVRPRHLGPNRRAIGARVFVTAGGREWMRPITAGTSFFGQEPAEAFFGLGAATAIETVRVEWPDGTVTERGPFEADQVVTMTPVAFRDVTDPLTIGRPGILTESLAWGDYDNDGDQDLYLTDDGPNRLLENDGAGAFVDVTESAAVGDPGFGVGAAFGDLDNDGDLDLYVVNFGVGIDALYRNDGPDSGDGRYRFSDVTVPAGTTDATSSRGMAFLDYDRDGLLDIYVNAIGPDILYRNLGDLRFANVASALGVATPGQGVGVVATDVDGNGWIDLYTGNRSSLPNRLYLNHRGVFTDVTLDAGIVEVGLGMGVLSFDYDNDADFDLYWTSWPPEPNALYRNVGGARFENVAVPTGTDDPAGWGISCNAGDIDNDGWEDFFVTNGFADSTSPNALFRNGGDGRFDDVTFLIGGGDFDGRGVGFADIDRDGDVDLCVTADAEQASRLWRNDAARNHWAVFELVGTCSNRSAIGARVAVRAGADIRAKEVSGGAGRGSQNSLPVEFGLGSNETIDRVDVVWPNGLEQSFGAVEIDRYHELVESAACRSAVVEVAERGLVWAAPGSADVAFDVVVGQLAPLRSSGGDFAAATTECLVTGGTEPTVPYASRPRSGRGFWFLVRVRDGGVVGSWDTGYGGQIDGRDAGLAAASGACP